MLKINGKKAAIGDFAKHRWVEDILYFDGPILSLLKGSTSQDLFYYWCDSDISRNRWLAIEVDRREIKEFKEKKITILDLVNNNDVVYVVDIDADLTPKKAWEVNVGSLPVEYMPSKESYFDIDLSPSGDDILEEPDTYDIKLDGQWFLEDLMQLPRIYIQLYSYIYTLQHLSRESVNNNAKNIFSRYPWRGGFSTVGFFKDLDKVIPSLHEPEIKKITYASPGYMRLELLGGVSEYLERAIISTYENLDELSGIYSEVRKYLKDNRLSKIDGSESDLKLNNDDRAFLDSKLFELSEGMCMKEYASDLKSLSGNELIAVKIILSVYRRMARIVSYRRKGMIRF